MSLTLRVTSFQKGALGQGSAKQFVERGGTIGRVKDNDWVLPDPERLISSRHAVVHYKNGEYLLSDTSANGTFVNGNAEPVGNGNQVLLGDGDRIAIGDYEIEVVIDSTSGLDIPSSIAPAFSADAEDVFASSAMGPAPFQEAGSSGTLDPLALLSGGGASAGTTASVWDFDESSPPQGASLADDLPSPSQAFQPPRARHESIPEDWDLGAGDLMPSPPSGPKARPRPAVVPPIPEPELTPIPRPPSPTPDDDTPPQVASASARQLPRKMPAPRRQEALPHSVAMDAGDTVAVDAFLRGTGLEPGQVSPEQAEVFMELVGQLFREMIEDLRDTLLARASMKSGFRMEQTMIRPTENNPLKFAAGGADEAMRNLLFRTGSSYLPPLRAVSEGFQDIKDHQVATMAGMQAAFGALLERFEPERLQRQFDKGTGGWSLLDVQKKSAYWEKFLELHAAVKEQAQEDFQNLFGVDFTRAYEGQMRKLAKARKADEGER